MTISTNRHQLEKDKFVERDDGQAAVAVDQGAGILSRTTGTETPADTDNALVVYDVGSGGASSTLVATHTSPADGSVEFTSSTTITCSGFPFTVDDDNCTIVYILYKPSGDDWQAPIVQGASGQSLTADSDVITVAGAGTPFASGDEYVVGIQYQEKAYNEVNNATQAIRLNPDSESYAGETLVDETDGADDTYYYYIDMSGYRGLNLQGVIDGGSGTCTVTIEATLQDDGTAADSCTYKDVTQYGFEDILDGTANASYTDDFYLSKKEILNAKYIRVKVVADTSGSDDADWAIYVKRNY